MRQILPILLILTYFQTIAQVTIKGRVTRAENGEPLIGATVSVKGSTRGTIVNAGGTFELKLPESSKDISLVAKFIGFQDSEKKINFGGLASYELNFEMISNDMQLADVVVSARRVEEFLQKVPVAATVINSGEIERRSVYSTIEALNNVPNMLTDSWLASQPSFSIRGLSSNFDNVGFESTVALYIDDVYFSRGFGFNSTLFDIERVEVLRGPQGTLFGKNTVGGVVNVVSETPEFATNGQAEINFGNYGFMQFRGKYNTELVKNKLAFRLTGAYTGRNGFIQDANRNSQAANKTRFGGFRGSLFYRPNDKTNVTGRFFYGRDGKGENTFVYGAGSEGEQPLGLPADGFTNTNQNTPNTFERDQYGASVKIESQLKFGLLTSITAYNSSIDKYFGDNDQTIKDVSGWGRNQELKNFSQEIRIASPRDKQFSYIAGLYYLNENIAGRDTFTLASDFLPLAEVLLGKPIGRIPGYLESATTNAQIKSQSAAAFFSGQYRINKQLNISGGLRFTSESKKMDYYQPISYFNFRQKDVRIIEYYAIELGTKNEPVKLSTLDNVFSGDVSLNYEINPFSMTYFKYSRGFKGAGFNTSVTYDSSGASLLFKPEFVNTFEFGYKSKFNERTKFNFAAFYVGYRNKQEILDQGYRISVANARRTNGAGVEGEFSWMYKRLRLDVSSGLVGMKYRDFIFGEDENGRPINYAGNRLLKAPNFTLSVAPQYTIELPSNKYRVILGGNINHVGKAYNDISNSEVLARRAATIVNARAALMPKNGKWSIALWGKNLTDARFIQHGFEYEWGNQISWSRPRYIGLEMYLNFF
ncbi:MAG: TonB-dependent receptor [Spirosomaceae bacterium]|jgi:iron complex outermembrane receptor protein|nr:TonB-dependent receptor [Spirosomataceae bacterium]